MANTPDFFEFDDWLIDGPAGKWSYGADELNHKQQTIVARNAELLSNPQAWADRCERFEELLSQISDTEERRSKRACFHVRFDLHQFTLSDNQDSFSEKKFPCSTFFNNTTFGDGDVSFHGATFGDGNLSFHDAKFGDGNVSFIDAKFGDGNVWFHGATFGKGDVLFSKATFGDGNVWFHGAKFGDGNLSFSKATFGDGNVSFIDAKFGDGNVSFQGAKFGDGNVSFQGAKFGDGNVLFIDAKFGDGKVWFHGATFGKGDVLFKDIKLSSTKVSFSDTLVEDNFNILTHFHDAVDFRRLTVNGTANFSGCKFDIVPDFQDAKLDRPPQVSGMHVEPPKMQRIGAKTNEWGSWTQPWCLVCEDADDVHKYRKLKSMAVDASDHEMDGKFFAMEMMAKRGVETKGFWPLLMNSFYAVFSGYGQSWERAGVSLLGCWMAFVTLFFLLIGSVLPWDDRFWFAVEFSLRNCLLFVKSALRFADKPTDNYISHFQVRIDTLHEAGVNIEMLNNIGVFEQFVSTVLLGLFALALRNTFRLK